MNKLSFLYGLGAGILIASIIFYSVLTINGGNTTETKNSEETQNIETQDGNGTQETSESQENSEIDTIPDEDKDEQNTQNNTTISDNGADNK